MKIEDIKNKKVLLAVKNTLKNSQLRKRITCGTVAFSFVLGMSLLEGDTKKEINEEPLILEDSMVEPIIAIATSIKPKTSDYERRPVILPPIIEPVGFDEGEEEEEEEY